MGQPTLTTTLYIHRERENKETYFKANFFVRTREHRLFFHLPHRTNPVTGKSTILSVRAQADNERNFRPTFFD